MTWSRDKTILVCLSMIMFLIYNIINFQSTYVNSPDEMVNREFIYNFAQHGTLTIPQNDPYTNLSEYIHPRSTYVRQNFILPVGFWGLIVIYGLVGTIVGVVATPYITSLLTIASMWALYFLWKKVFSANIALLSAAVFAFHPVVWYYSARSLFPNMPAFDLASIGSTILILRPITRKYIKYWWVDDVLGIIILGMSVLIRPVEVLWWFGILLILFFSYRNFFAWPRLLIWFFGAMITIGLFVYLNNFFYGDAAGTYISSSSLQVHNWLDYFLPFGLHIRASLYHVYIYGVRMFWWLVGPMIVGIVITISNYKNKIFFTKEKMVYACVTFWVTCWLVLYYGGSTDMSAIQGTIGVSYVRYAIPAFVLLIPFLFSGINIYKKNKFNFSVYIFCLFIIFCLSVRSAWSGIDGLRAQIGYARHAGEVSARILDITGEHDILITNTEDKLVWPKRDVMVKSMHPDIIRAAHEFLKQGRRAYYLGPEIPASMFLAINAQYKEFGIEMQPAIATISPHAIYPIWLINQ